MKELTKADIKALRAAQVIKTYCMGFKKCGDGCIFDITSDCLILVEDPDRWEPEYYLKMLEQREEKEERNRE